MGVAGVGGAVTLRSAPGQTMMMTTTTRSVVDGVGFVVVVVVVGPSRVIG